MVCELGEGNLRRLLLQHMRLHKCGHLMLMYCLQEAFSFYEAFDAVNAVGQGLQDAVAPCSAMHLAGIGTLDRDRGLWYQVVLVPWLEKKGVVCARWHLFPSGGGVSGPNSAWWTSRACRPLRGANL